MVGNTPLFVSNSKKHLRRHWTVQRSVKELISTSILKSSQEQINKDRTVRLYRKHPEKPQGLKKDHTFHLTVVSI